MSDDKIIDFGSFQNKVKDSDIDKLEEYMYSMYTNVSSGTMSPLDFSKSINEFLKKNNISVEKFGQMQEKLLERYGFDPKNIEEEMKRMGIDMNEGAYIINNTRKSLTASRTLEISWPFLRGTMVLKKRLSCITFWTTVSTRSSLSWMEAT